MSDEGAGPRSAMKQLFGEGMLSSSSSIPEQYVPQKGFGRVVGNGMAEWNTLLDSLGRMEAAVTRLARDVATDSHTSSAPRLRETLPSGHERPDVTEGSVPTQDRGCSSHVKPSKIKRLDFSFLNRIPVGFSSGECGEELSWNCDHDPIPHGCADSGAMSCPHGCAEHEGGTVRSFDSGQDDFEEACLWVKGSHRVEVRNFCWESPVGQKRDTGAISFPHSKLIPGCVSSL